VDDFRLVRAGSGGGTQQIAPRYLFHPSLKIGSGGSSDVFLGLQCDDGLELALKRISLPAGQGTI
jgi:hypothetical protein